MYYSCKGNFVHIIYIEERHILVHTLEGENGVLI